MPNVNNSFRYSITNRLGTIQVEPLGESDFTLEWNRQADLKLDYQQTLPSKITFKNDAAPVAYAALLKLEQSIYRCEFHYITVERSCTASGSLVWIPWFSGRFSLNDGDWFIDRCQVDIKLDEIQPGQCYDDNKGNELDFLALVTPRRTVILGTPGITIETEEFTGSYPSTIYTPCTFTPYFPGVGNPQQYGWNYYYNKYEANYNAISGIYTCTVTTKWAREVVTVACGNPSPGAEWILVEDLCPTGSKKYARPPRLYGCNTTTVTEGNPTSTTYECNVVGVGTLASIDNGMPLADVLIEGMAAVCPALTVVSDFFQINPDIASNINYFTGLKSKTDNIIVYQKSDVKRPNVANNATKAMGTLEDIVNGLCELYNCRYRAENGIFRIEHVSWFSKSIGFDLTQPAFARAVVGKFHYSYENQRIPQREEFKTDEYGKGDFTGLPIIYSGACVTAASRTNVITHNVENIATDLEFVLSNPDPDSKFVSDSGFVFVATEFDGTNYYVITETSILGGSTLNNSMAWAQLHRDYHKVFRPLRRGNMNGVDTVFADPQPIKKGVPITIPLCCNDTFYPDDLIITPLGMGTVDKASFSFKSGNLELDLLYPEDANLSTNLRPVAVNDYASTFTDVPVTINVKANDSDPDGNFTLGRVEIVTGPTDGTAVVQSNNTILYTPNTGFTGVDDIDYRVFDNWNEPSNVAHLQILVYISSTAPTATDDSYSTPQDTALNVAAPGLFANDTGPGLITLDSFTTPAHGTVTVNNDGSFIYTPTTGYNGPDSFTYTIINGGGLTDTATVNITVLDATNPVAFDDTYQTIRNQALIVSSADGLLANDITAVGTLTVTAGTFATTAGGSVTIAADGSFSFTPLLNFVGTDTFPYTVSNGTGTDTGTVTIIVQPVVFIRLVQIATNTGPLYRNCTGTPELTGSFNEGKFRLYFYSDSAGTVPLDVTGFGLVVNYGMVGTYLFIGGTYTNTYSIPVTGTQTDLFLGNFYRYYSDMINCDGYHDVLAYRNETIFLGNGNYIII